MSEEALQQKSQAEEGLATVESVSSRRGPSLGDAASRCLNIFLALVFLAPALLILAGLYALMKAINHDGGPFLYTGKRLGRGKQEFTIYKVRTLSMNAEQELGCELHTPGCRELRLGAFLRKSRLDELPQLFNILKGDMDFIGPRPVRAAVYEKNRTFIKHYDDRFLVRPGLTGFGQLFTPHKTPKRIRFIIDRHFMLRKRSSPLWEVGFILKTGLLVLRNTVLEAAASGFQLLRLLARTGALEERRKLRRLTRPGVVLDVLTPRPRQKEAAFKLIDINYQSLALASASPLDQQGTMLLEMRVKSPKNGGVKRIRCKARVDRQKPLPGGEQGFGYVVSYEPVTEFNRYLIDQYILGESIG